MIIKSLQYHIVLSTVLFTHIAIFFSISLSGIYYFFLTFGHSLKADIFVIIIAIPSIASNEILISVSD